MQMLSFDEIAEQVGLSARQARDLVREGLLVEVRNAEGVRGVPAAMIMDGEVVKSLPSVITQLRDAHYSDDDIVEWLFREDDSLPGSPIEALRANRGSEVKRRAQVAGF